MNGVLSDNDYNMSNEWHSFIDSLLNEFFLQFVTVNM